MPRVLTQRRGMALMELEEVGGARLTWCVAAALKNEIVSKEKQKKKKHLHGWGMDNRGQRPGQHSRVPGKDISKEKKTKIKKKTHAEGRQ